MAELKTKKNDASVTDFIKTVQDEQKQKDSLAIIKIMKQVTKSEPKMWGASIIGFGNYHYKYASGREGDWFVMGLSPRKQNLTLYLMGGLDQHKALLKKMGKHTMGKGCLYVKKLEGIDLKILKELIVQVAQELEQLEQK